MEPIQHLLPLTYNKKARVSSPNASPFINQSLEYLQE